MAKYYTHQIVTAEFRTDQGADADKIMADWCRKFVQTQGLTPISDPVITWREITQAQVDAETSRLFPYDQRPTFRVGDWRAICVLDVAEEAPWPLFAWAEL